MSLRLTENHPLTKKMRSLEVCMDKLGISLEWDGYHLIVTDTDTGINAHYKDNDSSEHLTEFPSCFESKLTKED